MKKTLLLVSALATGVSSLWAQSQRFSIVEHFTQASCGPCASANPGFQSLMVANSSKVLGVRYQVSWPGTDPMNAQNASQIATRDGYYNISGVPDDKMNGTLNTVSSSTINSEYALTSPFSIGLSYSFNAANDSIFIACTVTGSQAFTSSGALKLHIAMLEKTISFTSPPGSNGEKTFYNVLRKMYPSATGTTLASTWTTGQTQTINISAKIPTYIYQKTEIATVAWIQSDGNKRIQQGAFAPTPSSTTGINDVSIDFALSVYPNPSNGVFTASFEASTTDNYTVRIINTLGQVVYQEDLNNFIGTYSRQMDIGSYGKGVLFLVISNGKNENVKKLITQ